MGSTLQLISNSHLPSKIIMVGMSMTVNITLLLS